MRAKGSENDTYGYTHVKLFSYPVVITVTELLRKSNHQNYIRIYSLRGRKTLVFSLLQRFKLLTFPLLFSFSSFFWCFLPPPLPSFLSSFICNLFAYHPTHCPSPTFINSSSLVFLFHNFMRKLFWNAHITQYIFSCNRWKIESCSKIKFTSER